MSEWPTWFPAGCPPEDTAPSDAQFFRLVDSSEITEQDFWSHAERLEAGLDKPRRRPPDPCMAAGVSVHDSQAAADKNRSAFGALRTKKIAAGDLQNSGAVKRTTNSPGHHTWWRPSGDAAWSNFMVIP